MLKCYILRGAIKPVWARREFSHSGDRASWAWTFKLLLIMHYCCSRHHTLYREILVFYSLALKPFGQQQACCFIRQCRKLQVLYLVLCYINKSSNFSLFWTSSFCNRSNVPLLYSFHPVDSLYRASENHHLATMRLLSFSRAVLISRHSHCPVQCKLLVLP